MHIYFVLAASFAAVLMLICLNKQKYQHKSWFQLIYLIFGNSLQEYYFCIVRFLVI